MPHLRSPLETLFESAFEEGLSCSYLPADDQLPIETLLCDLGEVHGQDIIVECSFPQTLITIDDPELDLGEAPNVPDLLQLIVRFAIPMTESKAGELARLVIDLNRSLAVGQFGFCLETSTLYLQHALAITSRQIDPLIFSFIVGHFHFAFDWLLVTIKEVAHGALSRDAAIEKLRLDGFPIVPVYPGFSKED
jgi:hypothetical protein